MVYPKEYLKITLKSLKARPLRSWLTIIGVVIGVFLIISLLSLSEGIKTAILQQLRMMGKDLIMVFPGEMTNLVTMMVGGMKLSDEDLKAIEKTQGVESVVPFSWRAEALRVEGEKKTILLGGISWKEGLETLRSDMGLDLKDGRWPVSGKRELIVGSEVSEVLFPKMKVGSKATIQGREFEIVGILKSLGNKQDDSQVYMDLDVYREITGERTGAQFAYAKVKPGFSTDEVVEKIKESLDESRKKKRGEDLPSFSVLSSEKLTGIVEDIMALIQAAIFGFASIAIAVGGIGIMNTMYTSVHERIKEVGIMKAVGAKNKTIVIIFLVESGLVGLLGGLGGVILGLGLAKIVEIYFQIHPVFYLKAVVSPQLILFGLAFSFLVGCISGFLPARSASKLKPVDALRYE